MDKRDFKGEIVKLLRSSRRGFNISRISRDLSINRITVRKYLDDLMTGNKVSFKQLTKTRRIWFYK